VKRDPLAFALGTPKPKAKAKAHSTRLWSASGRKRKPVAHSALECQWLTRLWSASGRKRKPVAHSAPYIFLGLDPRPPPLLWSELSRMSLCGTRAEDTNIDFILYKHSTQICIYVYLCDTIFFCLHIYTFTRHKCKRIYIFVYCACHLQYNLTNIYVYLYLCTLLTRRGGGLGSRPKKMYGERLGDGVEYHLMKPTPRR